MSRETLNRWKNAVVHLECMGDSVDSNLKSAQSDLLLKQLAIGEISSEEFMREVSQGVRDVRQLGTALFVRHADQTFLVTARHVIWDKTLGERERDLDIARAQGEPELLRQFSIIAAHRRYLTEVFRFICRVPSYDEALSKPNDLPAGLMNLSADLDCQFSKQALDLAIISLDRTSDGFSRDLQRHGYEPVPSQEISDGPSREGADVFTVGFPGATAVLGQRDLDCAHSHWGSNAYSLPVFAFGKVSMLHADLDFFWCDMSIYPGNSGGPVVEDDRLVGIVSAQPWIPVDGDSSGTFRTRIPFAQVINAKHLIPLMDAQVERDRPFRTRAVE